MTCIEASAWVPGPGHPRHCPSLNSLLLGSSATPKSGEAEGRAGRYRHGLGALYQAALTSIILGVTTCGAGTLTSSMPFVYFAST